MNKLFETQKQQLIDDYEHRLRELEQLKDDQFKAMKDDMQKQIDELLETLRREREIAGGTTKEMQERL